MGMGGGGNKTETSNDRRGSSDSPPLEATRTGFRWLCANSGGVRCVYDKNRPTKKRDTLCRRRNILDRERKISTDFFWDRIHIYIERDWIHIIYVYMNILTYRIPSCGH